MADKPPANPDETKGQDQEFAGAAPSLSLPKGGGAIRAIGEKFAANPATGTGSMTVPIYTSPGRSGFGPQLSLSYNSGSGNGPFGLGWSLALPSITRRTDKGLPRYQDADESDIFVLSGSEDLVPVLVQGSQGQWIPETVPPRDGYTITYYRPRIEGLFARIERWTSQSDGDTYWRSISKDNVTTFYGQTPESRIADPDDPSHIFSWLISQSQDDKGDAVVYSYAAENSSNIDLTAVNERNRSADRRSSNRYLTRILYGNTQPLLIQPDITRQSWLFEVVFDYGEGYYQPSPPDADGRVFVSATLTPAGTWPVRQDPFSHYRSRFEVRTYRLCQRVLMFHHFDTELRSPDYLVRATEFTYQENPIASVMTSVTQSGYVLQGDSYLRASLPPLEFAYSQAQIQTELRDVDPESLANLPASVDGSRYRWLDLDGEGLQCVLAEHDDAWFYKRNLTPLSLAFKTGQSEPTARFEVQTEVWQLPALVQARAPRHRFMNLSGDGRLDCAVLERPGAGFYERTSAGGWEPFTALLSAPNIDWNDPDLRLIDLDGDGFSDILITAQDSLTYFPSLARFGFAAPVYLPKATDEEAGPAVVFADSAKAIFLADMSGDGLSDIVRIRNGEVCYWPNLGCGRFGTKITMDKAPWFDAPDIFDPARIRLADVDGSGVTDIIYLASQGVNFYFNQSGNAWSEPAQVMDFPPVSNLADIETLDLLGNGTVCLVWTSSAPGDTRRSMRYLSLMGREKPYLLVRSWNNLGAETHVHYTPSTTFYLADRASGTPWATRLPFPVQVVERVETYDWISRNRFVTRYAYHHGYYDGIEREFRGFGMVEQRDTEELGILTQTGAFPDAVNIDASSYVPPVLTKTWFHTGAYPMGRRVTRIYDSEYWSEPSLTPDEASAKLLPDSPLQPDLTGDEIREALRSLKGAMLRQEVYAQDGTPAAVLPYSVSERNYTINRLQAFGPNRHAVFLTHARESLDLHYERTLYSVAGAQVCDPRTSHAFVLEVDEFGNEKKSVAIAYGRQYEDPDTLLIASDRATQSVTSITYSESDYTNPILGQDDAYRSPMPAEVCTYELTGYTPSGTSGRFQSSDFVTQTPTGFSLIFDSEIPYEAVPTTGRQRRLIEQVRTLYRSDDLQAGLALRTLQSLALPFAAYKLALTPGLLTTVFVRPRAGQPPENLLPDPPVVIKGEGGYVLSDDQKTLGLFPASDPTGYWWIPSGQIFYSPAPTDSPAQELANAQANFFMGRRYQDIFLNNTTVTYDGYDLLPVQVEDPVKNIVAASNDYRVLQPELLTDANGNQSAVIFDALGLVVATAVMDKSISTQQDSVSGVTADPTQAQIDAFFADPRGPSAAELLGNATSRVVYDLGRFTQPPSTPQTPVPSCVGTILRETHVQDLAVNQASRLQVSVSYSDGFGREIQKKVQADPGPLVTNGPVVNPRWIGSGWTIWNNKGKSVRKYEPFFTDTADFSFGTTVGVSSTLFYDPVGRVVATLRPDHSWEKVIFDPWRQESWDANDTVLIPDPSADTDVGSYFARIPQADYMPTWYTNQSGAGAGTPAQQAAQKASVHAGTFSTVQFDALARAFLTFAFNRYQLDGAAPVENQYRTTVVFDIEGNQRSITDALLRVIMTYDYNMLSSRLHQSSVDAGDRWMLNDATGKPLVGWDSRDHCVQHDYDAARRPIQLWVQTGTQKALLAEQTVYGETQGNAQAVNLRGRVYEQYDAAGVVTNTAFDFQGNLLASSRELLVDPKDPIDWSLSPSPKLTGEVFMASSTFDALNRPVTMTSPDGSVIRPTYDDAGVLDQVNVNLQGAAAATPFVTEIDYDAKGQRTLIQYGNGSSTAYTYDPQTYRLLTLNTVRASDNAALQALSYTYDPVGNITHIADAAQQTIFFNNQVVDPSSDYVYDALYRLIQAQGRELIGLATQPQTTWDDTPRINQPLPTDGQAMRTYAETYNYDGVGNILSVVHSAINGSWTSNYAYDEPNNPPTNNRLTSTTVGPTESTYTYDAHGNMTTMSHLPLMAWDFKDQLQATQTQVATGGAVPTTYYVYDASGQRVRKVNATATGGVANERIYLGGFELYREYNGIGAKTLERQSLHVMDDKQRIALVESLTAGKDGSPPQLIRYQFGNQLGSAILELDETAQIISYEEYYPYGSTSYQGVDQSIEAAAKRYRYTGKERDEETGFNYHGARYYAHWLGIWISCDPARSSPSLSPYNYVSNRPTTRIDISGLSDLILPDLASPSLSIVAPTPERQQAWQESEQLIQKAEKRLSFEAKVKKFNREQREYNEQHSSFLQGLGDQAKDKIIDTVAALPGTVTQAARHPIDTATHLLNPLNAMDAIGRAEAAFSANFAQAALGQNDYQAGRDAMKAASDAMEVTASVIGAAEVTASIAKVPKSVLSDTRGSMRIPGTGTLEEKQLAKLADRLVPASTAQTAAISQAYEQTIAVGKSKPQAGTVAHALLGAKGPNQGIDYGVSAAGTLEPVTLSSGVKVTGVIKETATHWGGPMEMRQFTQKAEQLSKASRDFQLRFPSIVPLQIQEHFYRNPATGEVLRLTK
jgi:RHS repeat-associated protein